MWWLSEFSASLTASAPATVQAYSRDITGFVAWAERGGITGPGGVDRLLLRRYVGHLATRQMARRTMARAVSSLHRYFAFLVQRGFIAGHLWIDKSEARFHGSDCRVVYQPARGFGEWRMCSTADGTVKQSNS